jgi:hypothetical protein
MWPYEIRPLLLVLVAASVAAILPATPAAATWNKQPEVFCIAIPDPKYVGWESTGAARQYKFAWSGQSSTPKCPLLGTFVQNFGLSVQGIGTWDGATKKAVEHITFGVSAHPLNSYNGNWDLTITLDCPKDPWINKVSCKLVGNVANLPTSPYNSLYSAFAYGPPYPTTKVPAAEQQAIHTITIARAVTGLLEKSLTIKKPTSGAVVAVGGAVAVEITNPYGATVSLEFSPKGNTWAGSGAFTQTTKGTGVLVSGAKFKSTGPWTLRAYIPNVMPIGGGPSVDFVVGSP